MSQLSFFAGSIMKFHFWPVHLVAVTMVTSRTLWRRLCSCCITSGGMWIQARCLIRDQRIRLYVYVCFYLSWKKDQLLCRRCSLSQAPAESSLGQFSAPFWSCLDFSCRLMLKNIQQVYNIWSCLLTLVPVIDIYTSETRWCNRIEDFSLTFITNDARQFQDGLSRVYRAKLLSWQYSEESGRCLTVAGRLPPSAASRCWPIPPAGAPWWLAPGKTEAPPDVEGQSSWTSLPPRTASPTPGTPPLLPVSHHWTRLEEKVIEGFSF